MLNLAVNLGIEREVEFLGFQNNPFKYMRRSSLFVLSSLYEGFPNVILEAMALGLPVISADCPSGPGEIIADQQNGILVPVQDEHILAEAIVKVMRDESVRVVQIYPSHLNFYHISDNKVDSYPLAA